MARRRHRQRTIGHAGALSSTTQPRPPVSAADADTDSTYGSTSTLSASAATGSHVFTVADYSGSKVLHAAGGRPRGFPSDKFTAGGRSWLITYSPSGFPEDPADCVCFGLCLDERGAGADPDATVRIRTRFSLLDHAGQPAVPSATMDESERAMPHMRSLRYTKFMERTRFESCYVKDDNRFSVRCDVTVVTRTSRLHGVVPPPDLRRHLGELLAGGVGADVTFEVGGEEVAAHRSVLTARLPAFKAELFAGLLHEELAAANERVRIHDIEPSVFKALLHFVYTDSLPEMDAGDEAAMAQRLLVAAQRYGLERLEWICQDVLYTWLAFAT